jgi:hypothetical protein
MAIVPARKESPGEVSVRRVQLQKSAGSILASNKLARSAPKRVAVRVNGGLAGVASGTQVSGTTSANRSWRSAFIQVKGEGPAKTQDDVRASSSGRRMNAQAVRRSWDRGYKGHRILRRVLVGGRHLGLSRAISFHEGVVTATSAAFSRGRAMSCAQVQIKLKETRRRSDIPRKRERRQRCQRLDR